MTRLLMRLLHTVADTVPTNILLFGFWLAGFMALLIAFGTVIGAIVSSSVQRHGRCDRRA